MAHRNGEYGYIWNLKIPSRNRFGKYTLYIYTHPNHRGRSDKKNQGEISAKGPTQGVLPPPIEVTHLEGVFLFALLVRMGMEGMENLQMGMGLDKLPRTT